jgi:hypothetical protein
MKVDTKARSLINVQSPTDADWVEFYAYDEIADCEKQLISEPNS